MIGTVWIRFAHPWWLLAFLAAAGPVLMAISARRRGRRVGVAGTACQCLAVALAVVALAGPECRLPGTVVRPWLLLRDVSASLGAQGEQQLHLAEGLDIEEHRFADRVLGAGQRPLRQETNLSPVLRLAAGRAGSIAGVILLSDGRFHDDWRPAARRIEQTGIPMFIVAQDAAPRDARIVEFRARRRPSGQCELDITIAANAILRRTLKVRRILPAPEVLYDREFRLQPGRPITVRLGDSHPAGSAGLWEARITPPDLLRGNDTLTAAVLPDRQNIAWVAAEFAATNTVAAAPGLGTDVQAPGLGMNVQAIPPAQAPSRAVGWCSYSAVLLADATGLSLRPRQRKALGEYVRGGGGLVLIGGGPRQKPADRHDPLNLVAALVPDPFRRHPISLGVVLDASGSMAEAVRADSGAAPRGGRKFDLAGEAVLRLAEHLTPADRLKVVIFSGSPRLLYDSGSHRPDFAALGDALRAVRPAGATKIAPALKQVTSSPPTAGLEGLVLVLSDLRTENFDSAALAELFRANRWKLAIVATGPGEDSIIAPPLESLGRILRAPLVRRKHLRGLDDIFGRLCRQARGEPIRRGRFAITASHGWDTLAALKQVRAYVPSAPAKRSEVLGYIGDPGDPLLAWRRAGLGRCFTLAAAPSRADNPQWYTSPLRAKYLTLLVRMIRQARRPGGDGRFDVQFTRRRGLELRAEVRQVGRAVNGLNLQADVQPITAQAPRPLSVNLRQVAPGTYSGFVRLGRYADDALGVELRDTGSGAVVWHGAAEAKYPRELADLGADLEALGELAAISGGRIIPPDRLAEGDFGGELSSTPGRYRVWRFALAAAVVLMLLNWLATKTANRK